MPKLGYSYNKPVDEERTVRATGKEMRISFKDAVEICRELRGRRLAFAKEYLSDVIEMRRAVPYRHHNKGLAHRRGLKNACSGAYPKKAATHILKLLENAEANAEFKGLDTDRLFIRHIQAKKGRVLRGFIPRAFGRASPHNTTTTHVEVWLDER
ncbi:MAG: 50S ribosomal protein L22 [Methanobacteriota archaeon]|nr:MAG: 50S ribosomal protein L22 [Euryarchaeota archaeon]